MCLTKTSFTGLSRGGRLLVCALDTRSSVILHHRPSWCDKLFVSQIGPGVSPVVLFKAVQPGALGQLQAGNPPGALCRITLCPLSGCASGRQPKYWRSCPQAQIICHSERSVGLLQLAVPTAGSCREVSMIYPTRFDTQMRRDCTWTAIKRLV